MFFIRLVCLISILCSVTNSGEVDGAPYTNSWIGNTYGLPETHIPHSIDNLYVTPSGMVATITGWDEGGHNVALFGGDGAIDGYPVSSGTGAWGRSSGKAVFVNDDFLYQVIVQNGRDGANSNPDQYPQDQLTEWQCVRRYHPDGSAAPFSGGKGYDGSMLIVTKTTGDTGQELSGVLVLKGELYVSEPNTGMIKVYDAQTMSENAVRSFALANTGLLAADRTENLWHLDTVQKRIVRLSRFGVVQSQSIDLPAGVVPTAFCVDADRDRILVANNGADQNILIYSDILGVPSLTSTLGATKGINSGTPGVMGPLKFSEPRGVGVDAAGNIFVGCNGVLQGGARLEKYANNGTLKWRLNGLVFTDNGCLDPSDESAFFTKEFRYSLNLTSTSPGSEWSAQAMTINKDRYPDDVRIPAVDDSFWTTAYIRHVLGQRIMYISDMYGSGLAFYRFNANTDGETAIPSGFFSGDGVTDTIWSDQNGNGRHNAGEVVSRTPDNIYSTHIIPDANGGVWKTNREMPVRYFPMQGLDTHGNPLYTYDSSRSFRLTSLNDVKRIEYDAENDALYATGRIAATDGDVWWCAGNRLSKFTKGATNPTLAWNIDLSYGAGDTPLANLNVKAFCQAGDYLFLIAATEGRICVHLSSDGRKIGEILPTAATGNQSGWSDINGAIRATRRANGEYLIFAEENGNGKIMMYRWLPRPAAPFNLATSVVSATQIDLNWTDNSIGETAFIMERTIGRSGSWSQLAVMGANTTSYSDNNLMASTTYSYRMRASNASGDSATTNEVEATTPSDTNGRPPGWSGQDVGNVQATGALSVSNGIWTVTGSGADIWSAADGFQFAWHRMSGDVRFTAQVTGITNTNAWAKAGLMIRESLSAGSRHASVFATAGNGTCFQRRKTTDATSAHTSGPLRAIPVWIRIERIGNQLIGSTSSDGSVWAVIRRETVSMSSSVYVGFAVTSHMNGSLCTGTFRDVEVMGLAVTTN